MPPFSITEITANMGRLGFSFPNRYRVIIPEGGEDLSFNCSSVSTAGQNIGFVDDRQYGIGLARMFPNGMSFTDINLTFYQSESQNERKFFIDWHAKIYDKARRRLNYPNTYLKTIEVRQYNRANLNNYSIKMIDCFPASISPLEFSYENENQIQRFTVSIQTFDVEEIFPLAPNSVQGSPTVLV